MFVQVEKIILKKYLIMLTITPPLDLPPELSGVRVRVLISLGSPVHELSNGIRPQP